MPVNLIVGNDASNSLQGTAGADVIYGYNPDGSQSDASTITATRVASGLNEPVFTGAPAGDPGRLFIVEKSGLIKVLDLNTGQVLATPFLDVSSQILTDNERGLLGLAFDPNYAGNGLFYVYLINTSGNTEIRSYHVSANPNVADAASATPIITVPQPAASNHKGGWLGFGPDGYLYAALGEAGVQPSGQNINDLLGNILRIDVHGVGERQELCDTCRQSLRRDGRRRRDLRIRPTQSVAEQLRPRDWEPSTSPMSARAIGKRSTSARRAPITVGIPSKVRISIRGEMHSPARRRWLRSTRTITPSGIRSPAGMSIAARAKRCRASISSPTLF